MVDRSCAHNTRMLGFIPSAAIGRWEWSAVNLCDVALLVTPLTGEATALSLLKCFISCHAVVFVADVFNCNLEQADALLQVASRPSLLVSILVTSSHWVCGLALSTTISSALPRIPQSR